MDKVTVTQADREAAADAIIAISPELDRGGAWRHSRVRACRSGMADGHEFVQGFARHRIEATRQAEEQIKLLREALERIADRAAALKRTDDWFELVEIEVAARQALEATNG